MNEKPKKVISYANEDKLASKAILGTTIGGQEVQDIIINAYLEKHLKKIRINIKSLSVNRAWQGRRYKTPAYDRYEAEMVYLLPKNVVIQPGELQLNIRVGYSSKASDLDNCIKPFLDILSRKYSFNDKQIYRIEAEKEIVKKGREYIEFEIIKK